MRARALSSETPEGARVGISGVCAKNEASIKSTRKAYEHNAINMVRVCGARVSTTASSKDWTAPVDSRAGWPTKMAHAGTSWRRESRNASNPEKGVDTGGVWRAS